MENYKIYADGSCSPNPGAGACWFVILDANDIKVKEGGHHSPKTTNNRMELSGIIAGLKALPEKSEVEIYTDSKFCVNIINKWIKRWRKHGLEGRLNADLLEKLDNQLQYHSVKATWVKAHNGDKWNEVCNNQANRLRLQQRSELVGKPEIEQTISPKQKARLIKKPIQKKPIQKKP